MALLLTTYSTSATNLIVNGSFENLTMGWQFECCGAHKSIGGAAGGSYVEVNTWGKQEINTQPGTVYNIRFASRQYIPVVQFGGEIVAVSPTTGAPAVMGWNYYEALGTATSNSTVLEFQGTGWLDDVWVVATSEPIAVLAQPESRSSFAGGAVTFTVVADGGPRIAYQWSRDNSPLTWATNATVLLTNVSFSDAGLYTVLMSNAVGAVTSAGATLTVEPTPQEPLIVLHPNGDVVPSGYTFALTVSAVGEAPLRFQWFRDSIPIADATNRILVPPSDATNTGTYFVRVENNSGAVESLPAV
ncbi:MAG TPA: immunoglobulin domain-containing protein, partial [Candidatus Acidoferrum sp.]|nr:immunoglobulin domain-containing protein [Candidatus Acidoferrum sp.]